MLHPKQRKARLRSIENVRLLRITNLRRLAEMHGNWTGLEQLSRGRWSATFLVQIAGPNPRRQIGEILAREIESVLGLPAGWLDMQR